MFNPENNNPISMSTHAHQLLTHSVKYTAPATADSEATLSDILKVNILVQQRNTHKTQKKWKHKLATLPSIFSKTSSEHPTTSTIPHSETPHGEHQQLAYLQTSVMSEITHESPADNREECTLQVRDGRSVSPHYSSETDEGYAMRFSYFPGSENIPSDDESTLSNSELDNGKVESSSDVDQLMECTLPSVWVHSQPQPCHPLPFPKVSAEWYKRQYTLATKNVSRERYRQTNTPTFDEEDSIMYVNRSQVEGTLQENIQTLTQYAKETKDGSSEKRHTEALISVGKYILDHGPLVKTQDVGEVYKSKKGLVAI